jgi:hypothetical protein
MACQSPELRRKGNFKTDIPVLNVSNDAAQVMSMSLLHVPHFCTKLRFDRMAFGQKDASGVVEQTGSNGRSSDKPVKSKWKH